jgi:hypothetical protein
MICLAVAIMLKWAGVPIWCVAVQMYLRMLSCGFQFFLPVSVLIWLIGGHSSDHPPPAAVVEIKHGSVHLGNELSLHLTNLSTVLVRQHACVGS